MDYDRPYTIKEAKTIISQEIKNIIDNIVSGDMLANEYEVIVYDMMLDLDHLNAMELGTTEFVVFRECPMACTNYSIQELTVKK